MEDRKKIDRLLNVERLSRNEIAKRLGFGRNAIAMEVKLGMESFIGRNIDGYLDDEHHFLFDREHFYDWIVADKKSEQRKAKSHDWSKIERNTKLKRRVIKYLKIGLKPCVISGRLKLKNFGDENYHISVGAIYQWLYRLGNEEYKGYLAKGNRKPKPNRGVQRKNKPEIKGKVSIEERSKAVDNREEFGHFESDSVVSGVRSSGQALNTTIERKARKLFITRVADKSSDNTVDAMLNVFSNIPVQARKSVTMDNGTEFAKHYMLTDELGLLTYFAHPYSSYERGTNEQHNGLIRRFIPKGTDIGKVSEQDIRAAEKYWNTMPRKILDYKTPNEVWKEELKKITPNYPKQD
jgi:IS30 family transposase